MPRYFRPDLWMPGRNDAEAAIAARGAERSNVNPEPRTELEQEPRSQNLEV